MKILAVDTSSSICSVAILDDDKLIDKNELDDGRTHSENLMPLLDELLKRNSLVPQDIELIACCVGPGSFTGIRIGVATIKPIAEVLNIHVAAVMSLEALARNVENKSTIVSLIDARNNQVYCGIFDENYNKKEEYLADDINTIIEILKKYENITVVGNGVTLHRELLTQSLKNVEFSEKNSQSAEMVGKIGYKKYLENNLCTADTIMPVYLRKSQAERLKK
ncbi:MAG: tRNA (adenosine(37)-N6)-threonylcarbamoyltransferase complex dimerization subunit type 1 TsaB [Clostridia bacterium]|nr:tRNA (adenosine(37)-N6)-threonylcarbamoyltransferase complex dimerization subunit type 1 TsaB [Clostridia bacterium]